LGYITAAANCGYRKWVDSESYLLYPTAIGVSIPIPLRDTYP